MRNAAALALAYLRFHWIASVALILSIALIAAVPIATRIILTAGEASLLDRAGTTPLLLGARDSALDLTLGALYFDGPAPRSLTNGDAEAVWDSGLGIAIPLHLGLSARGQPVVGTRVDYFDFRGLALATGRPLAQIGDAVIGAGVARSLGLTAGDTLITDAQTLFDLAGVYPLQLTVSGVLARAHSADDDAVFVDLNTAWIIAGIGHGHDDPVATGDGQAVIASPAIAQFNRITPQNIDSFHLHADPAVLPIHAVIVVPTDDRASAIVQGRYLEQANPLQIVTPLTVIRGLLDTLLRIGRLIDLIVIIVSAATLIAVGLSLSLATRLRAAEMATFHRLGAHRRLIAMTICAQIGLILGFGLLAAATFVLPFAWFSSNVATVLITAGG